MTQVNDQEAYLVVNAGCREKDLAHIGAHLQKAKVRRAAPAPACAAPAPHLSRT